MVEEGYELHAIWYRCKESLLKDLCVGIHRCCWPVVLAGLRARVFEPSLGARALRSRSRARYLCMTPSCIENLKCGLVEKVRRGCFVLLQTALGRRPTSPVQTLVL